MNSGPKTTGLAILLGAGPGRAELITVAGLEWLRRADVVIYDRLAGEELLREAQAEAEMIDVGKQPDRHPVPQEQINTLLVEHVAAGKLVVRLKGGDPLIFGRGGEEADALAKAGLPFRIIPGISAAVAAGAFAGIPLTDRRAASSVAFVTGHEDPDKDESSLDFEALANIDTRDFYMGVGRLPHLTEQLIIAGKPADTPAAIVENAALPQQRTIGGTLAELPSLAEEAHIHPPSLIIVGPTTAMTRRLGWFEHLPLAGQTVLVTRTRSQSSELAAALNQAGAKVIECPTISIEPLENFAELDAAILKISDYNWLVFTSPNGVEAFAARAKSLYLDGRSLGHVKLAAIGPGTAAALESRFLKADLTPNIHTTAGLGEALSHEISSDDKLLLLRSDLADTQLPETLRAAGANVDNITAYHTVRPKSLPEEALAALRNGKVDWITFTSSSTVENFFALVGDVDISTVKLASIGPVTTETLLTFGHSPTVTAQPHTIDAMAETMINA